jgi:hypothetical protein
MRYSAASLIIGAVNQLLRPSTRTRGAIALAEEAQKSKPDF